MNQSKGLFYKVRILLLAILVSSSWVVRLVAAAEFDPSGMLGCNVALAPDSTSGGYESRFVRVEADRLDQALGDPYRLLLEAKVEFDFLSKLSSGEGDPGESYEGAFLEALTRVRHLVAIGKHASTRWSEVLSQATLLVDSGDHGRANISHQGNLTTIEVPTTVPFFGRSISMPLPLTAVEVTLKGDHRNSSREELLRIAQSKLITLQFEALRFVDAMEDLDAAFQGTNGIDLPLDKGAGLIVQRLNQRFPLISRELIIARENAMSVELRGSDAMPQRVRLRKIALDFQNLVGAPPRVDDVRGQLRFVQSVLDLAAASKSTVDIDLAELRLYEALPGEFGVMQGLANQLSKSAAFYQRAAANLSAFILQLKMRAENLSIERDRSELVAGVAGLRAMLATAHLLTFGIPANEFDLSWSSTVEVPPPPLLTALALSRIYVSAAAKTWFGNTGQKANVFQWNFSAANQLYVTTAAVMRSEKPAVAGLKGNRFLLVNESFDDGKRVILLRKSDVVRDESGRRFQIVSIETLSDRDQLTSDSEPKIESVPPIVRPVVLVDTVNYKKGIPQLERRELTWDEIQTLRSDSEGQEAFEKEIRVAQKVSQQVSTESFIGAFPSLSGRRSGSN